MRKLALGIASLTVVVVSFGVLTAGGERGAVGEIGGVPPGQARTLNLTLKPGHYSLR